MVVRRRKKSRKLRGSRTHGWGSIGQHRKSGSRGGVGAVGYCKHKWTWLLKYFPDWYGKHGFTRPPVIRTKIRAINVGQLNELVEQLLLRKEIEESDGYIDIDLSAIGINKLLGGGKVNRKLRVRVAYATKQAVRKIEEVGGEVILLKPGSTSD